ncbi:unnamed protein product [Urochloa decumbens]|uniref:G-protein coupled receptors family 1 profile domain-containing protein n=1 Tax=Urochloa decumbens TaxID=240449 RepID=A0ABC9C135_9POAL
MAGVGESMAPPQAPSQTGRSAGAALPRARGPLALAVDVVLCCFQAALWACCATAAAAIAARQVCGMDSRAAAVTEAHFLASVLAMCALYFASMLLFAWFPDSFETEDREIGGDGDADATGPAAERRRPENTGARGRQDARRRSPYAASIFSLAFMLFMPVAVLINVMHVLQVKQSWMERFCMLAEIGLFDCSAALSIAKFPALMVQLRSTYAKLKRGTAGVN